MRAYSLAVAKVLYCLSLTALAGCVSSGAKAPGANAPCKTTDGCPSGYQCLPATTGASGLFCCGQDHLRSFGLGWRGRGSDRRSRSGHRRHYRVGRAFIERRRY
jgi:hypothetical protein